MEFLHGAWPGGLADPIPMGVEPAPRVEPAVATHLDASHRVFPPLKLMSCHQETLRQEHPSVHHTGHMQREEEALGDKTFSHNLMGRCACCMPPALLTAAHRPSCSGRRSCG